MKRVFVLMFCLVVLSLSLIATPNALARGGERDALISETAGSPVQAASPSIVFAEDFEGFSPGADTVTDKLTAGPEELDYWNVTDYRAHGGSKSAWCAQEGVNSQNWDMLFTENFDEWWWPEGTDWVVGDSNPLNGEDYWWGTNQRLHTGYGSAWSARVGDKDKTFTIFTEDFESRTWDSDWTIGDGDPYAGLDYWGRQNLVVYSGSWSGWCALVGTQSDTGKSNVEARKYDDGMHAYMYRTVLLEWPDGAPAVSASLHYHYWVNSESGHDILSVGYRDHSGIWHYIDRHGGDSGGWKSSTVSIPVYTDVGLTDAVGFFFDSDRLNHNYPGAVIDGIVFTCVYTGSNNFWHEYDDNMDAYAYKPIDMYGYGYGYLTYYYWLDCEPDADYLQYMYNSGGTWHYGSKITGNSSGWQYSWYNVIPESATDVGWRFYSNGVNSNYEGAYIDTANLIAYPYNWKCHRYDDDMLAVMWWNVDLSGYSSVSLSYWYWLDAYYGPTIHDYLCVEYYSEGTWHYEPFHEGNSGGWQSSTVSIPTTATIVGFLFKGDVAENEGAYLDDVICTGTPAFEFSVSATPLSRIVVAGASTTYTATATLVTSPTQTVSWSASGLPVGATYTFTPLSGLPTFSSTLKITTGTATPPGSYTITITGTGPCIHGSHSTSVQLKVLNFTVTPTPFSPNGDGRNDKTTIRATFWASLSWTLVIKNSTGTLVRSLGSGTGSSLTRVWDGKDDSGIVVPDGTYKVWLSGPGFTKTKNVIVDTSPPTVTGVSVSPTSFNLRLGEKTKINYTLSESCYVTIKIFNSTGSLVKTRLNNVLQATGPKSVVWGGRDDAGKIVKPGKYTIKIFVVDLAGNRASPYPITKTVTVLV